MTVRHSTKDLPAAPAPCNVADCVYQAYGSCDNPRINRGNGDARCHRMAVPRLLKILQDSARGQSKP